VVANELSRASASRQVLPTGIVDCDVHVELENGASILEYMSRSWRKRFELRYYNRSRPAAPQSERTPQPLGKAGRREGASPPGGGTPGSNPAFTAMQALDPFNVTSALLTQTKAAINHYTNADDATAVAAASNDYFIERWLPADSRYRLAILIAPQDPNEAAKEIRRHAANPQVAAVFLSPIQISAGSRYYDPIYAAASSEDLPIVFHPGGGEGNYQGAPTNAGGIHSTYAEHYSALCQYGMAHLQSIIFEGPLEKFPNLRFGFLELGWTWVPSLLWRMDSAWKGARIEVPWVKKAPTEYVTERIRFASQPAVEVPNQKYLDIQLEMMNASHTMMFSSDYPHYDSDDADQVFTKVSPELKQRIFRDNALSTFPRLL